MPAKEVARYVCDMEDYRRVWVMPVWPFVAIPVVAVALIILAIALIG